MSSAGAVLAVAVLGSFMAFVDATIVNIAVPNIAHDFSGSRLSGVSWVQLVIDRSGLLTDAIGASMSLPLIGRDLTPR